MASNNTTQSLPLQDRVAIVTGGSRGIGKAISLHLASLGTKLSPAIAIKADVSDPLQVQTLFDAAESAFDSPIYVMVNAAGIMDPTYPLIMNSSLEEFDRIFAVNTRGAYLCCKEAAKRLKQGGGGRIICLTTSLVGALKPGYGPYTASKAAVEAMVKILAKELKGTKITANCVAPGPIATEMFFEGKTEEMVNKAIEMIPLGRLGVPEDVSPLVGFLASDGGVMKMRKLVLEKGMVKESGKSVIEVVGGGVEEFVCGKKARFRGNDIEKVLWSLSKMPDFEYS
nr:short-chain type dehydrogenase/reductase-like [Tanacetum cinerariifolium]